MVFDKDLIGAWRLLAHYYLDDDGTVAEGPMGDKADGILIYHADGYMAASLMRTEPATDGATYLGSADDYLGYSGSWSLRAGEVVHNVVIGSHARVVNTEQVREVTLAEGVLSLRRRLDGPHDWVVMDWQRTG
ncbi:lipocalin-like domain-containing protein [Kibdelosporangium philippinense]|uniref:Lipocalin-like domain-containing protein n=1 Tax=Kibdelosporangium philippinense TaxID=211113 RepID=A0ABS8Z5Q8_9PSEU|nr:lipocalin-like domain-containing protein [Kibdelosporangium philippinense]MCE7003233.1 lipocalin-like domain-containing protein [Kibdelosporangium philippinense]